MAKYPNPGFFFRGGGAVVVVTVVTGGMDKRAAIFCIHYTHYTL